MNKDDKIDVSEEEIKDYNKDIARILHFFSILHGDNCSNLVSFYGENKVDCCILNPKDKKSINETGYWLLDKLIRKVNCYYHFSVIDPTHFNKAGRENVILMPGLFCDIDIESVRQDNEKEWKEECKKVLSIINSHPQKPSFVVYSGGGLQPGWIFDKPLSIEKMVELESRLCGLIEYFESVGGDPACKDASRVLRIPYTWNNPNSNKVEKGRVLTKTSLFQVDNENRYSLDMFDKGEYTSHSTSLTKVKSPSAGVPINVDKVLNTHVEDKILADKTEWDSRIGLFKAQKFIENCIAINIDDKNFRFEMFKDKNRFKVEPGNINDSVFSIICYMASYAILPETCQKLLEEPLYQNENGVMFSWFSSCTWDVSDEPYYKEMADGSKTLVKPWTDEQAWNYIEGKKKSVYIRESFEGQFGSKVNKLQSNMDRFTELHLDEVTDTRDLDNIITKPLKIVSPRYVETLEEMNQTHFVTSIGAKNAKKKFTIVAIESENCYSLYSKDDFHNLHYNKTIEMEVTKNGKKEIVEIPLSKLWFKSPMRREHAGFTFDPEKPTGVTNIFNKDEEFNTFLGWKYKPLKNEDNKDSHLSILRHLFEVICCSDFNHFEYMVKWTAHIFQKTKVKPMVVPVFRSQEEGTGKNLFIIYGIGNLLGDHYLESGNDDSVFGTFTGQLKSIILSHLAEATFAGDKKIRDKFKGMISDYHFQMREMYMPYEGIINYWRFIISTNNPWSVPASIDSRRFFCLEVSPHRVGDFDYFDNIMNDMKNKGGHERLLYFYLNEVDLGFFEPKKYPLTSELMEQRLQSLGSIDSWWFNCLSRGYLIDSDLRIQWEDEVTVRDMYDDFTKYCNARGIKYHIKDESGLGKYISNLGIPGATTGRKFVCGWDVEKNVDKKTRLTCYSFPNIEICRDNFMEKMKIDNDNVSMDWSSFGKVVKSQRNNTISFEEAYEKIINENNNNPFTPEILEMLK